MTDNKENNVTQMSSDLINTAKEIERSIEIEFLDKMSKFDTQGFAVMVNDIAKDLSNGDPKMYEDVTLAIMRGVAVGMAHERVISRRACKAVKQDDES